MSEQLPLKSYALTVAYEKDYVIEDSALDEPLVIFRTVGNMGRSAWWNGEIGKTKVQMMINAIKMRFPFKATLIYAGITQRQWQYFNEAHPHFCLAKDRLKETMNVLALGGLFKDIQNPDNSKVRQWYLEKTFPEIYGKNIGVQPIPATATKKLTAEAFLDEAGKVLASKQTLETWENDYGVSDDSQGED